MFSIIVEYINKDYRKKIRANSSVILLKIKFDISKKIMFYYNQ